ncbi:MAG: amidase, partial [Rhizobiaceae bacterium]|nr:amidase [Rhizobiaceae bacterium]
MTDATGLAADIAARKISARELTENAIQAIEERDVDMNAVVVHAFEAARAAAIEADTLLAAGQRLPLLGVPITIKESFDVATLPTSWGLSVFRDVIAQEDAASVARLRKAGAIILGKTNVSEGLNGWDANNPVYGRTNHPLNRDWTPGGSSAGAAAAVAAGLSALDIGSDLGGSIRLPAHFCGIYGHNATAGLIPLRGHVLSGRKARLDMSAPGPMARSARDLALGLSIMAGPDDDEAVGYRLDLPPPRHTSIRHFRVLVIDRHPAVATDPEVRRAVTDFAAELASFGAGVRPAEGFIPDLNVTLGIYMRLLGGALGLGQTPEAARETRAKVDALDPDDTSISAARLRAGVISHADWLGANEERIKLRWQWREIFRDFDAVICPPAPVAALSHSDAASDIIMIDGISTHRGDQVAWASIATAAGLPATVMPYSSTQ